MNIQSNKAYAAYSYLNATGNRSQTQTGEPAKFSDYLTNNPDKVSISGTARSMQSGQSAGSGEAGNGATAVFETDQGRKEINIVDYFTPGKRTDGMSLISGSFPPLLLPTKDNIDALAKHISSVFPAFLSNNGIPEAPETITYDDHGQIQLPEDYEYASELKQALEDNPAMEKELRTVNVLSSVYTAMQKSLEFNQEYSAAATQAEIDAVLAKYSYLFGDNRTVSSATLHFSENGSLSITVDDKALA